MATKKTAKKKSATKKAATKIKEPAAAPKAPEAQPAAKKAVTKKAVKKTVKKNAAEAPASSKPKESSSTPPLTTIVADIDVGWGNAIYLRGEGGPLSWEKGILMDCAGGKWTWSTTDASDGLEFKFMLNNKTWAKGENNSVAAGSTAVLRPTF